MATITLRVTDQKADKLKRLAEKMNVSVNKLLDEMTTAAISHDDAKMRFDIRAAQGLRDRGLATLDRLDTYFADNASQNAPSSSAVNEPTQESFDHGDKK